MAEENDPNSSAKENPPKPRPFEYVEPEDGMVFVYANHFRVGATAYDLRIRLGELVDIDADKFTIEDRAHVTVSWIVAKQLMETLKRNIDAYESANGPINMAATAPLL